MSAASSNLGIRTSAKSPSIVHDLPRATAFYRDVLGLPLPFHRAPIWLSLIAVGCV